MSTPIQPGRHVDKDPAAKVVKGINWGEWLGDAEIVTSTWAISGHDAALTYDNATIVTGNQRTSLRLIGGTVAQVYTVTNHIVTNETPAQEDERSFTVKIVQR